MVGNCGEKVEVTMTTNPVLVRYQNVMEDEHLQIEYMMEAN
jgi:hypothetical protein